ncbi:MAG: hypothetical protein HDT43_08080 [Ruminococcaceae bacterium]|nr:hypothetical protein [Oscillospiraceae bacterium]
MKKILIVFTIFFFAAMLFLTVFAEKIHENSLPKVTASRPEQKPFPFEYIDENGVSQTGSAQQIAVPESMLESGVYAVYSAEKNGTKRDFVRLVTVQTGAVSGGYAEVVSGLMFSDRIVIESNKELYDGCEVKVVK